MTIHPELSINTCLSKSNLVQFPVWKKKARLTQNTPRMANHLFWQIQVLLTDTWTAPWRHCLQLGQIIAPFASVKEKDTEAAGNRAIPWLLHCSVVAQNLTSNLCLIEITFMPSSSTFSISQACYLWNYRFTEMQKQTVITVFQEQTCW